MYEVVSSSTPSYYPGIIALWNSIKINSPMCSLTVFAYDKTEEYKELEDMGIKIILNAPMLGPILDESRFRTSSGAPVNSDMYARLLVDHYFDCERVFYVDADCLILNPIYELWDTLDLQGNYTACVWRPDIGWAGGSIHNDMASGTFLADIALWKKENISQKCFDIMRDKKRGLVIESFGMNVESVLSYIHNDNWLKLDRTYQNLTYYGLLSTEDKVAHFASRKPWNNGKVNYKKLWKAYHTVDMVTIEEIESKLLPEKTKARLTPGTRPGLRSKQNKWSS